MKEKEKAEGGKQKAGRKFWVWFTLVSLTFMLAGAVGVDTHYPWLAAYVADQILPKEKPPANVPIHVLFLFVDHFEPHDQAAMDRWMKDYPELARRHKDSDGKFPQHSWFWYFDKSDDEEKLNFLKQLATLSYEGLGEVELHLHHYNDTEKTFLEKINHMIRLSQETGAFVTRETRPRTAFGFIHGLWGLDNSRGAGACGINNELILLREVGCYADFTHPSWGPMHPRIVNRLYYATDDPLRPKSYDKGVGMKVGAPGVGDLLIFEGPSVVRFNSPKPVYDHGDVTHVDLPTPKRMDGWIKTGIHVERRPEWIFVKIFTHGAISEDHDAVLGQSADKMYEYLETKYNDGKKYVLHYVTAREAYNIAKAAEAGMSGNPNDYRDFIVPPYANRFLTSSAPYELISMDEHKAVIRFLAKPATPIELRLRASGVKVSGNAEVKSRKQTGDETFLTLISKGEGVVGFIYV